MPIERHIISTPMPSADEVADSLGISLSRRKAIAKIAKSAIDNYYAANPPREPLTRKKSPSPKKAAA
jgi:hypothetical protein